MGISNDNQLAAYREWLADSMARQVERMYMLGPVQTGRVTSQSSNVKEVEKPMNPSYSKYFEPSYAQTKMAGTLQAPAPIALVVRDERVPAPLPSKPLDLIPSGTVFQGRIGSITGTFKKNQNTVCQLDGHSVWMTPNTYTTGGFNGPCHNYQPVHGRVIIERNA